MKKKLNFKRVTIANLNNSQQQSILGGRRTNYSCDPCTDTGGGDDNEQNPTAKVPGTKNHSEYNAPICDGVPIDPPTTLEHPTGP